MEQYWIKWEESGVALGSCAGIEVVLVLLMTVFFFRNEQQEVSCSVGSTYPRGRHLAVVPLTSTQPSTKVKDFICSLGSWRREGRHETDLAQPGKL